MNFSIDHFNINVTDLEKSLAFYKEALGLEEYKHIEAHDGSYVLSFIGNDSSNLRIELTWLRDKEGKYELGDNESHIALRTDKFEEAYAYHKEKGFVCFENKAMGLYFIEDPDGYWIEILPKK